MLRAFVTSPQYHTHTRCGSSFRYHSVNALPSHTRNTTPFKCAGAASGTIFCEGIASTHPQKPHPSSVQEQYYSLQGGLSQLFFITCLITTPRTLSCGCSEVLSHSVVDHTPFVAVASYTFITRVTENSTHPTGCHTW